MLEIHFQDPAGSLRTGLRFASTGLRFVSTGLQIHFRPTCRFIFDRPALRFDRPAIHFQDRPRPRPRSLSFGVLLIIFGDAKMGLKEELGNSWQLLRASAVSLGSVSQKLFPEFQSFL